MKSGIVQSTVLGSTRGRNEKCVQYFVRKFKGSDYWKTSVHMKREILKTDFRKMECEEAD
jgi:hypothetical protein